MVRPSGLQDRNDISPPLSISSEAQAALKGIVRSPRSYPPVDDIDAWRKDVAERDKGLEIYHERILADPLINSVNAPRRRLGNSEVVIAESPNRRFGPEKIYYDIHGGALIYMGGTHVDAHAKRYAVQYGVDVVSIDYRMAPDFPYPASLDDCVEVYRLLIEKHGAENVIVGGASAGSNLAAATVLRARDEGLSLPQGLVLLSPEVDLTESGDTFQTLSGLCLLESLMPVNEVYAQGAPLDDPYLSPLFGDFSKGFPRTFLQAGTRDLFLSNAVRMHRSLRDAGIEAELHVWEAMPHGGFMGAPEDAEIVVETVKFLSKCWQQG